MGSAVEQALGQSDLSEREQTRVRHTSRKLRVAHTRSSVYVENRVMAARH